MSEHPSVNKYMMINVSLLLYVGIHKNSQNGVKNDGKNADTGVHAQTHILEGNVALTE